MTTTTIEYTGILPKPDMLLTYKPEQLPNITERHYQLDSNTILVLTESQDLEEDLFYGLFLFRGNINTIADNHNIWTDRYVELAITDKPAVIACQLEHWLKLYQY